MSKILPIFAANGDIHPILLGLESKHHLQYAEAGLFEVAAQPVWSSAKEIDSLGEARVGDQAQERRFIIVDVAEEIRVREVPQRNGGMRYAVDQLHNPRSIVLAPGGVFQSVVIAGSVGTASEDSASLRLFQEFSRAIKRAFSRIKSYYVGPEAARLAAEGHRLTTGVRASREYDLAIDEWDHR